MFKPHFVHSKLVVFLAQWFICDLRLKQYQNMDVKRRSVKNVTTIGGEKFRLKMFSEKEMV